MPHPLLRPGLRLAYRLAYRALRCWWWLRRPPASGAAVALWGPDGLLVVRPSYRRELDLPGGGRGRGESAAACAVRELREEAGVTVGPAILGEVRVLRFQHDHRAIELTVLDCRPAGPPPLPVADRVEVLEAFYATPAALGARELAPGLRAYLDAVAAAAAVADRDDYRARTDHDEMPGAAVIDPRTSA